MSKTAVDGLVWAHSFNRGYAYTFLCNPDYSVTVTDVLDAESDIAIINRTTERMINYARTGASVRRNSSLNGQQRNGNQPSNNSGGTHAQTSQSQGTKGLVSQPSQSNRQGSDGTGAQNRTNSGANQTRNAQKVKFSREAADKAYLDAVESGDMETAQNAVNSAARNAGYEYRMFHETDAENIHVFDIACGDHGATDCETPYGIFTKTSAKNIGLGSKQMALFVKAQNTLHVENREDVRNKIPEFEQYYSQIQEIDRKYDALAEQYEDEEFDALQEWMEENPDADMDVVYPTSYIIEGKPADIDSERYLEAHRKYRKSGLKHTMP